MSTVPSGTGDDCGYPDGYAEMTGTSQAAPHVAGVAALLYAMGCEREQAHEILLGTARPPVLPLGPRGMWTPVLGAGIVDAALATETAAEHCG